MSGSRDWIERCLVYAQQKAAGGERAVPDAVVETFRALLTDRFQRSLKPDELKQAVIELATANSQPDAPR